MMRRLMVAFTGLALSLAFSLAPRTAAADAPRRVISLNLCTDQLVIDLAAPGQIAAVSRLAADPLLSNHAIAAQDIPKTTGGLEDILSRDPDLVVTGPFTDAAKLDVLRSAGIGVLVVPLANDFSALRAAIRTVGNALNVPDRAASIIADFDERLAAARSTVDSRPSALAYQANGLVSGPDSLFDAIMDAAGYRNLARDRQLGAAGRVPLESLITSPPDLLIVANSADTYRTVLADNLRHPALRYIMQTRPSVQVPMPMWLCATPAAADVVALLAAKKGSKVALKGQR